MSISSSVTISTAALRPIESLLEEKGLSSNDIFSNFGLDTPIENGGSTRVAIPKFDQIIEYVGRALDEPAIGLIAGQRFQLKSMYLLSFLISNCQTGRDILSVLRRYYTLVSDIKKPDFFIGQDQVKIVFYTDGGAPLGNQVRTEFITSAIHSCCDTMAKQYYSVTSIGYKHPPLGYRDRLQKHFNVPIQYNQTHNWITLSARYIDSPLNYANPLLFSNLKSETNEALQKLNHLQPFSRKVMYILSQWPETVPMTKDCVAELLSTSSRTLTRRLQEENCQFSNLVREVRLEKAKHSLTTAKTDVQQLALNLGFSDRRGFERAFKHWTGITPAAYRKQHTQTESHSNSAKQRDMSIRIDNAVREQSILHSRDTEDRIENEQYATGANDIESLENPVD